MRTRLLCSLLTLALATAATAWSPQTQIAIADQASTVAPPDLARQIERHRRQFREGAVAPFRGTQAADHVANEDGSGDLKAVVGREVERAVQMIQGHRPFAEIVHQLGVVSHFVADASNPLNSSATDPDEGKYFADYLRYAESAHGRFKVSFYGIDSAIGTDDYVPQMIDRALAQSRSLYPLLGAEYGRLPSPDGRKYFDDRSTAYGLTNLAFSHAVTDVAGVLRYVWLSAGGGDDRQGLPEREGLPTREGTEP